MTRDADFKAIVRGRARRRGVPYAQARREAVARGPRREASTLHVTSGDSAAGTIGEIGLGGTVLAWRDVLHEGPVPAGSAAGLRAARACFLAAWAAGATIADASRAAAGEAPRPAGRRDGDVAGVERELAQRDAELAARHERYVLWFEADLYDQLQLLQVLDGLAEAGVAPERIELVSAGEFPGVAHFGGLGELTAEALAGLYEQRVALGSEAVGLARQAWAAFRAPEPADLAGLAGVRSRELRFLGEAIARLLQEYPWRGDGLSLTQRRILQALGGRPRKAGELFRDAWAREPRPYLGDDVFYGYVRGLADCEHSLVEIAADAERFPDRAVSLTEMGGYALAGSFDHLAFNAPERWIGGVHLTARRHWRYDPRLETLTPG